VPDVRNESSRRDRPVSARYVSGMYGEDLMGNELSSQGQVRKARGVLEKAEALFRSRSHAATCRRAVWLSTDAGSL